MLILQLILTSMLAGLCWTIQVVVYPQFANVPSQFAAYHGAHMTRITWVVAPLMLGELVLGGLMVAQLATPLAWGLAALTGLVWLSTAFIQVPLHNRLESNGLDLAVVQRLVWSNWIRTGAWTLRVVGLAWLAVG
jgi:hypothetical protein